MDMRIAGGVNIAKAAIDDRRFVKNGHMVRRHQVACRARLYACPGTHSHQKRQPADLEIGAGTENQVGLAYPRNEAWPGADMVGVLAGVVAENASIFSPPTSRASAAHSGSQANIRRSAAAGDGNATPQATARRTLSDFFTILLLNTDARHERRCS